MKWTRGLLFALLLISPAIAAAAQGPERLQGKVGNSAFSIDLPAGWKVVPQSDGYQATTAVFDLTPSSLSNYVDSSSSQFYIRVAYYPDRVPITARLRWEHSMPSRELARIDGLSQWSLTESGVRMTAYTTLGSDVVLFHLNAQQSNRFEEGKQVLIAMLRSYKEEKVSSGP